jgi:glyoxylase-like metal-dependent hydrolase (beta-lactamase superfamily II)
VRFLALFAALRKRICIDLSGSFALFVHFALFVVQTPPRNADKSQTGVLMTTVQPYQPGIWLTERAFPAEGFTVRGALILGSAHAVVWDSLAHPQDMQPLLPLIGNRPLTVVYSHADWDHAWGTAGLPYDQVIGHAVCRQRFASDVPATLQMKQAEQPGVWDAVQLIPPTIVFAERYTLDLGGVTLELHSLPGHTYDCIVGLLPEWNILLAGDTVETPLPVLEPDSPRQRWIDKLAAWQTDPRVRWVIPAHGPIGGFELIEATLTYLRDLPHSTVPDDLDAFYRETHATNVEYVERGF